MNPIIKIASYLALVVTIAPGALFFFGAIELEAMKWVTLAGTIAWFLTAPLWIGRPVSDSPEQRVSDT